MTPYKIHCYSKLVAKQSARETNILLYLHPNTRPTVQHLSPVTLPYMLIFLQSYADETSALYLLEEIVTVSQYLYGIDYEHDSLLQCYTSIRQICTKLSV